ncbi:DUF21 domain-containing protein [Neolecta irregularis DAH-3]|uniref:DUF21 domain-containing protein n=1 Tax=Neolecta irregularis (strain DAH-3) TaxID=1198029 RepID=A0A1U7LHJ0_NEOID|nr:DUF21 domain-containing protein [Neolecta irregularis DAH-3]|eukprot:OLL22117.1 DUF21 domain-containing protein [Neolecta irregularis DAH-3]
MKLLPQHAPKETTEFLPWLRRTNNIRIILALLAICCASGFSSASAAPVDPPQFGWLLKRNQNNHSAGSKAGEIVAIAMLVLLSGIFAGLTLGYMALDATQLSVLAQSGTALQRKYASRILPLRRKGHLLLVTLLLGNVICNETLPIISEDTLGAGVLAVVISAALIVIFAEILPQAICTQYGLSIGYYAAPFVQAAIYMLLPLSWPISKLLDCMIGAHHGVIYRRAELKELINIHSSQRPEGGDLNIDAVTIMRGALDLQEKSVRDVLTPIQDVFMLPLHAKLDRLTIKEIVASGHSRVPVYEETSTKTDDGEIKWKRLVGALLVKNLILLDPDDAIPLRDIKINAMPTVQESLGLFDILNSFQEGNSHMAIVIPSPPQPECLGLASDSVSRVSSRNSSNGSKTTVVQISPPQSPQWTRDEIENLPPIGIITLEDVLEELIQEPIWDESDPIAARPRAGLAIPFETGGRIILATQRSTAKRNQSETGKSNTSGKEKGRSTVVPVSITIPQDAISPSRAPEDITATTAHHINKHLRNVQGQQTPSQDRPSVSSSFNARNKFKSQPLLLRPVSRAASVPGSLNEKIEERPPSPSLSAPVGQHGERPTSRSSLRKGLFQKKNENLI